MADSAIGAAQPAAPDELRTDASATTAATAPRTDEGEALVEQELLVEDVSIDGMCGVY